MSEIFRTSETGLAAYLLLLGHNCLGAVPVEGDEKRFDFVFEGVDNAGELAQEYLENKAVGKLKAYRQKLQQLNHILRAESISREELENLRNG